jgi:chemotaxis response regulator CheB
MLKVLVFIKNPIMGEAIVQFLSHRNEVSVMRAELTAEGDIASIVNHFQPDVIVLEGELVKINLAGNTSLVFDHRNIKVITIFSDKNKIEILDRQLIPVTGLSDLLALIKGVGDSRSAPNKEVIN